MNSNVAFFQSDDHDSHRSVVSAHDRLWIGVYSSKIGHSSSQSQKVSRWYQSCSPKYDWRFDWRDQSWGTCAIWVRIDTQVSFCLASLFTAEGFQVSHALCSLHKFQRNGPKWCQLDLKCALLGLYSGLQASRALQLSVLAAWLD